MQHVARLARALFLQPSRKSLMAIHRWSTCFVLPLSSLLVWMLAAPASAAPPEAAQLASACATCHGTNGTSAGPSIPNLAGQLANNLVDSMNDFRSGVRASTVMGRIAKAYTEDEYALLGDYFAAQKPNPAQQNLDPQRISRGAQIHVVQCGSCHGGSARVSTSDSATLTGQWLPYLQIQMALFQKGNRRMPMRMAAKIESLTPEDLDALLQFYASVK